MPDNLKISLTDKEIVSLFANLLDNAREACERCSEKSTQSTEMTDEKQLAHISESPDWQSSLEISIAITSTGNDICIAVENNKPSDEHSDVKDIKTSKPDKENHGFGVAIIRSIVAKYGGMMQMSDGGEVFRVEINIPEILA